jgi:hypothetical protein
VLVPENGTPVDRILQWLWEDLFNHNILLNLMSQIDIMQLFLIEFSYESKFYGQDVLKAVTDPELWLRLIRI